MSPNRFPLIALAAALLGAVSTSSHEPGRPSDPFRSNKDLARRWFDDIINQRDLDVIADVYAADYVWHGPEGEQIHGPAQARVFAAAILAASDDRKAVVQQQVAEGDLVVTRFTSRGHHTGPWQGIPATGAVWTTEGIVISRIKDGKIVEDWEVTHISGIPGAGPQ
jgi:steroid delta-isomerase-like uncharacterized protein